MESKVKNRDLKMELVETKWRKVDASGGYVFVNRGVKDS